MGGGGWMPDPWTASSRPPLRGAMPALAALLALLLLSLASGQAPGRRVIGFDARGRITIQGDRSGLGLRGSASSEFVPTLSDRTEGTQVPISESQRTQARDRQKGLEAEALTLAASPVRERTLQLAQVG